MADRLRNILELAERRRLEITRDAESWRSFLRNAAPHYKYSFDDQVLIEAQRPDATACAPLPMWNKTFGRWVKKGSRGIQLVEYQGETPRSRYVFDISDTSEGRNPPRKPEIWRLSGEHEPPVMETLREYYGDYEGGSIKEYLRALVSDLTADHGGIDESYPRLVAATALYTILSRCGIDTGDMGGDFEGIAEYDTAEAASELGGAASDISGQVLRQIEMAVKYYEREKNLNVLSALSNERDETHGIEEYGVRRPERLAGDERGRLDGQGQPDERDSTDGTGGEHGDREDDRPRDRPGIHAGGGLLDSGPDAAGDGADRTDRTKTADGEIRPDEAGSPGEEREEPSVGAEIAWAPDGTPGEYRGDGEPEDRIDYDRTPEEEPAPGQSGEPDGLGQTHEHDESPGGRDDNGADPRVRDGIPEPAYNPPYSVGDSVYLDKGDVAFVIARIGPSSVSVRDTSANTRVPILRNIGKEAFEAFLRDNPLNFPEKDASDINGQPEPLPAPPAAEETVQTHTPEERAYKIGDSVYLDEEREYIIEGIGPLFQDVSLLDTSMAYPLSRVLSKTDFEELYNANPRNFPERGQESKTTPDIPRTPRQLSIFPSEEEQIWGIGTQTGNRARTPMDDANIDFALTLGGPIEGSKERIADICREYGQPKDTAGALKKEYGVGGGTVTYPDGARGWVGYGPKGINLTKGPDERATLSWANARDRLVKLVMSGEYGVKLPSIFERDEPSIIKEAGAEPDSPETREIDVPEISATLPETPKLDYRIPDAPREYGGPKTRYRNNIEAIKTLKAIESDGRLATAEEQEILSLYVGWGGLPQAFDSRNEKWSGEYAELKELLSVDEYQSAAASTLNAHYTSPAVIKAMYGALGNMDFEGGPGKKILEPAMGIGNFFGMLPEKMSGSELHGVELDSISGRISKQLYQTADIRISGFEKTNYPRNYFDAAIGNVPFGSYKLADPEYDNKNFLIHDYFVAKSLDAVRPGGVMAFVTSKGTMDKENLFARLHLAQRAELLGAIRLPNTAFLDNAGTEVTTDILFLQKRERAIEFPPGEEPEWVHLGRTEDGIPVNQYFAEHPGMILGRMAYGESLYGNDRDTACLPFEGKDLTELLDGAIGQIQGQIRDYSISSDEEEEREWIPADPDVRNWSYTLVDGKIYYRQGYAMYPEKLPEADENRLKALLELEHCVKTLISYQQNDYSDANIEAAQRYLNELYDDFTGQYGLISDRANAKIFGKDSAYYLLCSLEILDENGRLERKADMFDKRTIRRYSAPESVDTPAEALAVSLAEKGRVDIGYMGRLTDMGRDEITGELRGVIFPNPQKKDQEGNYVYETSDEYLSGAVRQKLETAKIFAEREPDVFADNVKALEASQPAWLSANDISVRLGSTWVGREYVEQFMYELLETPVPYRGYISVEYSPHTADWNVTNKNHDWQNVKANSTYGTSRMNSYAIIDRTLNLKDVRVYDTVTDEQGREVTRLNKKESALAQMKQEEIKAAFRDWIFRDPDRREILVDKYNALFNSTRPREYDGSHLVFPGMNPEIDLREHQRSAVAHVLYGGNTLLAHEVGAGKTYEMAASAMESKRLGLCGKSLFVVPNHLTEQTASEFLRLYPAANILVATKKDFEAANRKKFCARIATGDYDAVILGHSQFEKIPVSLERQEDFIRDQINDITDAIDELAASKGEKFTVKQLQKTKKSLEAKLERLTSQDRKDDVVTFEELGVDRLYVDESHGFKNLFLYTKMRNVAGISQNDAQKSSDMFMKCRYMDETQGGKGVIFATGTPVSNSMTELYSTMRYLQYDKLKDMHLEHFDAWASTFGETTTSVELAPEGNGYRARTRFAKFYNLPELMAVFKDAADIKTADTLNLPRPEAEFHNIAVKPTETQKSLVQELSERAANVSNRLVEPHEDNMLKITTDGRKIGLDQRLMNPAYPDEPGSKVNACMENIYKIWDETKEGKLTQLLFCDFSTPGKDKFNVYDDIKTKLVQKGIPEKEIAYIHDADTEMKKKELFAKVRNGSVRILMGSTQKMGSGTNVQDKLIALHDLDCPWRPADLAQRAGRIIRQGNENERVHVYRYVTEGTFDSYLWQTVENKQKFIAQIMTSKSPARSCEDMDESVLSYAEVKALCAGNPLIKEKMTLEVEAGKLRMAKSSHESNIYALQDKLRKQYPTSIKYAEERLKGLKQDEELGAKTRGLEEFPGMEIMGARYAKRDEAAEALNKICSGVASSIPANLGSYRGFSMSVKLSDFYRKPEITLKGEISHRVDLGDSPSGNIVRLNNALDRMPELIAEQEEKLENIHKQIRNAEEEAGKPFPKETELEEKLVRLRELDIALNLDGGTGVEGEVLPPTEEVAAKDTGARSVANERESLIDSAKLKLGGNSIITDAQKGRSYSGDVLEVGERYAVQKISRGQGILHSLGKAPGLLEMIESHGKENIVIAYGKDGKCSAAPKGNGQERDNAVSY
jgi:N12 class adenine-specific DNA methylase